MAPHGIVGISPFFCTSPPRSLYGCGRPVSAVTLSGALTIPYRYCRRRLSCYDKNISAHSRIPRASAKRIFLCVSAVTLSGALAIPYRYIGVPAKRMFCGVMSGAPAESIFGGVSLRCFPCLCENILAPESAFSTSAKRIFLCVSAHSRIPRASAKCVFLCVSAVTLSGALTIPRNYSGVPAEFLQEIRWGIIPGPPPKAFSVGYHSGVPAKRMFCGVFFGGE